ncbi:hypothetical protein P171DRAFT_492241 [Karstenula rhodostoma CBS 690.94]|uniref:Uncharacterized protein n=1 Tax=Karstenula rhodostoma CBS 690.94 TaxID=1392251 RepID=A0A9P4P603_9PLEO|nr:hypothetical protein P171DRAFT_492241 [Karstenula rhodostoma CBS 690.94]
MHLFLLLALTAALTEATLPSYRETAKFDSRITSPDWTVRPQALKDYFVFKPPFSEASTSTIAPSTPEERGVELGVLVSDPRRVHVSLRMQYKFSVKSEGHASMQGTSNIDNGITIHLQNLKKIQQSHTKKILAFGLGPQVGICLHGAAQAWDTGQWSERL